MVLAESPGGTAARALCVGRLSWWPLFISRRAVPFVVACPPAPSPSDSAMATSNRRNPAIHPVKPEVPVRSHHVIAIAVLLVAGFGVKVMFFSSQAARAEALPSVVRMDVLQMHLDYPNMKYLPVQDVKADLM